MTASSIYFQSLPYAITPETNLIDYAGLSAQAKIFKPRLIICGASAYPRDWDYAELKKIATREGSWLMADIAHTSGLVAAQELKSPFEYCDVVTTTTYVFCSLDSCGVILNTISTVIRLFVVLVLVSSSSGKTTRMHLILRNVLTMLSSLLARVVLTTMFVSCCQIYNSSSRILPLDHRWHRHRPSPGLPTGI